MLINAYCRYLFFLSCDCGKTCMTYILVALLYKMFFFVATNKNPNHWIWPSRSKQWHLGPCQRGTRDPSRVILNRNETLNSFIQSCVDACAVVGGLLGAMPCLVHGIKFTGSCSRLGDGCQLGPVNSYRQGWKQPDCSAFHTTFALISYAFICCHCLATH